METIECALEAIRKGSFALVVDDFDRENEGDFVGSASSASKESVALMLRHTSGVLCVPITPARADALRLPLMVPNNEDPYRTAFTVTVDYRHGTCTGISAADRAATIAAMANEAVHPDDFTRPGHIFPLLYRPGGVLVRGGHTEASIDMVRLAGCGDVAYLSEVYEHATGEMLRLPGLLSLASALALPLVSIADLQRWRYRREVLVEGLQKSSEFMQNGEQGTFGEFRSLYGDTAYEVVSHVVHHSDSRRHEAGTEGQEGGGVAARGSTRVRILFNAVCGPEHSGKVEERDVDGGNEVTIRVRGLPWENVRGKESANLATLPGSPYHARPVPSHLVPPSAALGLGTCSPESAYSTLYPDPLGASVAAGMSGFGLQAVCDRVCAELAQVLTTVATGTSIRALYPGAALEGCGDGWEWGQPQDTEGSDAALGAVLRPTWPAATIVVTAGQPVPRLWMYGVHVAGFQVV